jgi:hypothetical protein
MSSRIRRRKKRIFREHETQWVKKIKRGSLIEEIGAKKHKYIVLERGCPDPQYSLSGGLQGELDMFKVYNLLNRITVSMTTTELRARYKLLIA